MARAGMGGWLGTASWSIPLQPLVWPFPMPVVHTVPCGTCLTGSGLTGTVTADSARVDSTTCPLASPDDMGNSERPQTWPFDNYSRYNLDPSNIIAATTLNFRTVATATYGPYANLPTITNSQVMDSALKVDTDIVYRQGGGWGSSPGPTFATASGWIPLQTNGEYQA